MKHLVILLLLFATVQPLLAQEREVVKWTFLERDIEDIDTIVRFQPYLLEVDFTDTLYVANPIYINKLNGFKAAYDELRLSVEENLPEAQRILNSELTLAISELSSNVDLLEEKYGLSLTQNIENNKLLREENQMIQTNLEQSLKELDSAKQKIRTERWNKLGTKLLWGVGGLLVGGTFIAISN